jgi:hypothetical protein
MAEGPLGKEKRGSWLVSARKSYAQYVAGRLTDDPAQAFGYLDQQGKLTYDLTSRQTVSLHAINGQSEYDQSSKGSKLGVNSLMLGDYHMTLAQAGWRFVPGSKLLFQASAAFMREKYANTNKDARPLDSGYYGEWVGNANGTWYWIGKNALQAGWSLRRLRADGSDYQYIDTGNTLRVLSRYRGTGVRQGGYAQQSWSELGGRLSLSAGVRFDAFDAAGPFAASPHASAGFGLTKSMQFGFGWGQYV